VAEHDRGGHLGEDSPPRHHRDAVVERAEREQNGRAPEQGREPCRAAGQHESRDGEAGEHRGASQIGGGALVAFVPNRVVVEVGAPGDRGGDRGYDHREGRRQKECPQPSHRAGTSIGAAPSRW
jgi:hypothetical protein